MSRILASLGAMVALAAPAALAQSVDQDMNHDEGGGGCVYDRQVYPQSAQLCQDGILMRCDAGGWDQIGACSGGSEPAPNASGGDEDESDD